jgi:trigger factor
MNIYKEQIDELNVVLHINLEKSDYEEKVVKVLNDYKRKARIDGFRPGKVPFGMINKMYRKPVQAEEINKIISESISKFLVEEKLAILGEPLPHVGDEKTIDWENDSEFEFKFDLGLAPIIDIQVSDKDKIPSYSMKPDKDLIDKYVDSYTQRFGQFVNVENIEERDILKGSIEQIDNNGIKIENGISVEEASLSVGVIKDEKIKEQFLKAKKGDRVVFDLRKAFTSDVEIAAMLKIEKEKVASVQGNFAAVIKEISRFQKANLNQELFNKVYGEDTVKSEQEFIDKISQEAGKGLKMDSEYRFKIDAKDVLMKKFKGNFPVDFLKRWLLIVNEGKLSAEQIDQDFEHFAEDLKWQLIKDKLIAENKIEVTDEDLKKGAIDFTRIQFAQYGLSNMPDEQLAEFASRMLTKDEEKGKIKQKVTEDKLFETIRSTVNVDEKEITIEKFNKLFEK